MRSFTQRDSLLAEIGAKLEKEQKSATKGETLTRKAFRRLMKNYAARISLIVMFFIVALALFGPYFVRYTYDYIDWEYISDAPSAVHYFGTDRIGRDLLVRIFYGMRISLLVALVATLVSVVIGVLYGAIAGYFGGKVDQVMMRIVDIMYSLPYILFVVLLMVSFQRIYL